MSDSFASHQSESPVSYCQNCGKPLDDSTARTVGSAVFCEPCLAARIAGAPTPAGQPPFTSVPPASAPAGSWGTAQPANPGLAALLGLIPGVGAMYNGQYAKGVVHLIIFALLVTLTDSNDIFGIFVAGWVFYMAFEAHHTARARRDGTPLPNPFGLNDIGERLGFGRAWPEGPGVGAVVNDAAQAAGFRGTRPAAPPPAAAWGAPADTWSTPPAGASYGVPYTQPVPPPGAAPWEHAWANPAAQPWQPVNPADPAATYPSYPGAWPPPPGTPPFVPAAPPRFPAGAVWLIGLGAILLLGTTGIFHGIRGEALTGLVLIGLSVWLFLRRMSESGVPLANDGAPAYQWRLFRAFRAPVWLCLLGFLFLLDTFTGLHLNRSWPLLIILAGLMALFERMAVGSAYGASWPPPPPPAQPAPPGSQPSAPAQSGSALVPSNPLSILHSDDKGGN